MLALGDEGCFALVPGLEDFVRGRASEDAGMDEAGKPDTRNVAGAAVNALEVPDGFGAGV